MVTWKKLSYISIGIVFTFIVSMSLLAFAEHTAPAKEGDVVYGTFMNYEEDELILVLEKGEEARYPLASTVWVLRSQQKSSLKDLVEGDQVEAILNAKGQVAYIKANHQTETAEVSPETTSASSVDRSKNNAVKSDSVSVPLQLPVLPQLSVQSGISVFDKPIKLELKADGMELKLEHHTEGHVEKNKVELKLGDEEVKLKGAEAEQFFQQLMQPSELVQAQRLEDIAILLVNGLGLQTNMEWELKLQVGEEKLEWQSDDLNDDHAGKGKAKGKGKGKGRDDEREED
jgi:hypothetical protein